MKSVKTTEEILYALDCGNNLKADCLKCAYEMPGCTGYFEADAAALIRKLDDENRALRTELLVNGKNIANAVPDENDGDSAPDQTAKQDDGKLNPLYVPTAAIWAIAEVRRLGILKYKDPLNYRTVEKERLRAAAYRHWLKYIEKPDLMDDETGLPHLWHCITNLSFLCDMEQYDVKGK